MRIRYLTIRSLRNHTGMKNHTDQSRAHAVWLEHVNVWNANVQMLHMACLPALTACSLPVVSLVFHAELVLWVIGNP